MIHGESAGMAGSKKSKSMVVVDHEEGETEVRRLGALFVSAKKCGFVAYSCGNGSFKKESLR